jgi:hypothetical protein
MTMSLSYWQNGILKRINRKCKLLEGDFRGVENNYKSGNIYQ